MSKRQVLNKKNLGIEPGLPLQASAGGIEELRRDIQRLIGGDTKAAPLADGVQRQAFMPAKLAALHVDDWAGAQAIGALLAQQVAVIAAWDEAGRPSPHLTVLPAATPDEDLPVGCVLNKRHTRLVISWQTTHSS